MSLKEASGDGNYHENLFAKDVDVSEAHSPRMLVRHIELLCKGCLFFSKPSDTRKNPRCTNDGVRPAEQLKYSLVNSCGKRKQLP